MQTFKKLVSKISGQSIFSKIIESKNVSEDQYAEAVQQFSQLETDKKEETLQEIFGTFKRERSTRAILSALLLIDYLNSLSPEITLFHNCSEPKASKEQSIGKKIIILNEKIFLAEEQFIKFYFEFLKKNCKKVEKEIDFLNCTLNEWVEYCDVSINQILELIKIDYVLAFLVKNTLNSEIFKLILTSIFQKVSFDIQIINRFLEKHLRVITKKHELSFKINEIYEKILFINTNFQKFHFYVKNLDKKIIFEEYEVDKELNKSIQVELFERSEEKKEYLNSSRKKIEENKKGTFDSEKESELKSVEGETMLRLNEFI